VSINELKFGNGRFEDNGVSIKKKLVHSFAAKSLDSKENNIFLVKLLVTI
jgi:hypothetical protein